MNKYQKEFISMDGRAFYADVYRVLQAFGVTCPAVQHAVKKLLMPGQRGDKSEVQDLEEARTSVAQAIDMAWGRLRRSDGASDVREPMAEAEPEPEPMKAAPVTRPAHTESTVKLKPKLVTWRLCVLLEPWQIDDKTLGPVFVKWHPSENIPQFWYPVESYNQPIETVKQLPEGQEP